MSDATLAEAISAAVEARLAKPLPAPIDVVAVAQRIRSGRRGTTLVSFLELKALADFVITQTSNAEEDGNGHDR